MTTHARRPEPPILSSYWGDEDGGAGSRPSSEGKESHRGLCYALPCTAGVGSAPRKSGTCFGNPLTGIPSRCIGSRQSWDLSGMDCFCTVMRTRLLTKPPCYGTRGKLPRFCSGRFSILFDYTAQGQIENPGKSGFENFDHGDSWSSSR